jgi:gliding motility-associated-like protein
VGNRFRFSNASTNVLGTMQYLWDFGRTGSATSLSPVYSFPVAGQFNVKLVVRTNDVCADSLSVPVTIDANPIPLFDANSICVGLPFLVNNLTKESIGSPIHYSWVMDKNPISEVRTPPSAIFNVPGSHEVTLSVYSDQCPLPVQILTKTFQVEDQVTGKRYPIAFALRDFPLLVEARKIGISARWQPSSQLSDADIYSPVFKGTMDRQYTITLTTQGGCTTVDTLLVQIVEKAEIMVPTAFTPNGDGLNDFLRPVPLGVKEMRYFKVFNRWGGLVFDSRATNPVWDGSFKGMKQASQSYIWMAEGVSFSGEIISRKGTSVLIR